MSLPPVVELDISEPLQEFYSDGKGNFWSVARLLDCAKDLPVFDVPLAAIDLSGVIWSGAEISELAYHVKKCMDADLQYPILLDWQGAIADGRHRVLRALAEGRSTIKAKRMTSRPAPCHTEKPE